MQRAALISRPGSDQTTSKASVVMSAIRRAPPIARVDISRVTGLSPATVTAVTSDLLSAGLLEEVPQADGTTEMRRGRPRVFLDIRGDARLVLGAKLSDRRLTCTLLDFRGRQIADAQYPVQTEAASPQAIAALIVDATSDILDQAGMAVDQLSALGIGLPGFVESPNGIVYWSPSLDRRNVDLLGILRPKLPCPVFLDNDANLVAMAELWFGLGRDRGDFIVVTLEHGVGMGIVIGGQLYRGGRGRGGEFGHTKVSLDGALCRCGQRGCLEAYVGDYALVREADLITGLRDGSIDTRLAALHTAANNGDSAAVDVFARAGRMFGMGLANLVNIFDPKLIVLSGGSLRYEYLYDEAAMTVMRDNILKTDDALPEVKVHKWGDLLWAKGAAAMALDGVTDLALAALSREPV